MCKRTVLLACGWAVLTLMVPRQGHCASPPQQVEGPAMERAEPATPGQVSAGPDTQGHEAQANENSRLKAVDGPASAEPWQISESPLRWRELGRNFLQDQKQIWTSPLRLRFSDTEWLVPLAGITAGLLVTDRDVSLHLSHSPSTISHYNTLSNAGVGALVGGAAGMFLLSYPAHNSHWRETGLLAAQAAFNTMIPVEVMKYSLGRERPSTGNGAGEFFQGGTSFPSEHAAAAWAVAGVIGHEYPGPLPRLLAYGLASMVSYARVRAQQHFPSDVFVGGILGSLIAQQVYSRHHDPELGGDAWRSIGDIVRSDGSPANLGSPYVPLDSWIYPALDRLAAFGLIDSGFAAMRPWTRLECARLVNEGAEKFGSAGDENAAAAGLITTLQREFAPDLEAPERGDAGTFRVESVYSRTGYISGTPLRDGFDFGQTVINDFGRPYGQGLNNVTGFSTYATQGRWVGYFRGEWQSSAGLPALPLEARQTIQQLDRYPELPPATGQPALSQFQVLDAYVGLMFSNWQVSFGRQSLWWGAGDGGPMMFSDNAVPINMFRINRTTPFQLPSVFGWLGPMRLELFLGQLSGQNFIAINGARGTFLHTLNPQPMIHGERFSFKPTPDFEFGFSRTVLFAGQGIPFTLETLKNSFFSLSVSNGTPGTQADPGDRRSGMDWSYRVPRLRDWVTFYGDAFADDQISPIAYLDRSAIRAGLYFSRVPKIPKLDLRVEGVYTDLPAGGKLSHGFFYFNDRYLNGYTSQGQLLGSWIGREAQGAQGWANYWFSAKNRFQVNFRHQKVSQQFVPGGGTLTDVGVSNDYWIRPNIGLSTTVQVERWLFPVIQPNAARNVSATVELQFQPQKMFRRSSSTVLPGAGNRP
jgi:membrane-associated phospholipid phosphatase